MNLAPHSELPKPYVAFYGDDFTGGIANLAAFHRNGLRSLMFLRTPTEDWTATAREYDVVGIAGVGRSLAPEPMREEVEPALRYLAGLGSPVVQYKVCSTFDSSPRIGSFGVVLELARRLIRGTPVMVLAADPMMGRYTVFGNHFAREGEQVARLDRHLVMSQHPTTPMREADLRRVLAEQSPLKQALVDIRVVRHGGAALANALERSGRSADVVVFDALTDDDIDGVASLVWERALAGQVFTLAAQGLAWGLARRLRPADYEPIATDLQPVDKTVVFSGSGSELTARQIEKVGRSGWALIPLDVARLVTHQAEPTGCEALWTQIAEALQGGRSAVVYTALGPHDPALAAARSAAEGMGLSTDKLIDAIGAHFGELARRCVADLGLRRLGLSGGDTSSRVARSLAAYALSVRAVHTDGGTIATLHATTPAFDGVELLLKGGQVGGETIFQDLLTGENWL